MGGKGGTLATSSGVFSPPNDGVNCGRVVVVVVGGGGERGV